MQQIFHKTGWRHRKWMMGRISGRASFCCISESLAVFIAFFGTVGSRWAQRKMEEKKMTKALRSSVYWAYPKIRRVLLHIWRYDLLFGVFWNGWLSLSEKKSRREGSDSSFALENLLVAGYIGKRRDIVWKKTTRDEVYEVVASSFTFKLSNSQTLKLSWLGKDFPWNLV